MLSSTNKIVITFQYFTNILDYYFALVVPISIIVSTVVYVS